MSNLLYPSFFSLIIAYLDTLIFNNIMKSKKYHDSQREEKIKRTKK